MGLARGRLRVGVLNGKIENLRALTLGYVQRERIPADLPVKTTDDVDQGGGGGCGGDGRKHVSGQVVTSIIFFVFSSLTRMQPCLVPRVTNVLAPPSR